MPKTAQQHFIDSVRKSRDEQIAAIEIAIRDCQILDNTDPDYALACDAAALLVGALKACSIGEIAELTRIAVVGAGS